MATTKAKKKTAQTKEVKPAEVIRGFKTVDINMCSWHDSTFKFEVGKTFKPKNLKKSHFNKEPCGVGLHFSPTKEGAIRYADQEDYILLEVEAQKKNLMGADDSKFRVSELKILKVLEEHLNTNRVALERVRNSVPSLLKPNKQATPQKLQALFKAFAKDFRLTNCKLHIVNNTFEAIAALENSNLTLPFNLDENDHVSNFALPLIATLDALRSTALDVVDEIMIGIMSLYLQVNSLDKNFLSNKKKGAGALLQMLELGCLPLGEGNKHFLLYVPQESPEKLPPYLKRLKK